MSKLLEPKLENLEFFIFNGFKIGIMLGIVIGIVFTIFGYTLVKLLLILLS